MSFTSQIAQIFRGNPDTIGVQYTRYPIEAIGTLFTLDKTSGKYTYAPAGAQEVQVIAAGLIGVPFWVAGVALNTPDFACIYIVKVMSGLAGAGVQIAEVQFGEMIATGITGFTIWLPVPPKLLTGTAVCADMACSDVSADHTARTAVMVRT